MKNQLKTILFALGIALLASGGTYLAMRSGLFAPPQAPHSVDSAQAETKTTKIMYHCPMHPQIIRDQPGTCPICAMDLVPMQDHDGHGDLPEDAIQVEASIMQSIGVRVAEVKESDLVKTTQVTGSVAIDPQRVAVVNARSMGWIEAIPQGVEGSRVYAGQRLSSFYSPDLVAAQEDYLQALRSQDESLSKSARKRLEVLGIPSSVIDSIGESKSSIRSLPITAPIGGVVMARNIVQGQNIMPGFDMYRIADLSHVWIVGNVYPEDINHLKTGMNVQVKLQGNEGEKWMGKIVFVAPTVDAQTKTTEVRVDVRNTPDLKFKPGMNADMHIEYGLGQGIAIPSQAVIRTGERTVAIVSLGNGNFAPRQLTLGENLGDSVQVLEGLSAGDSLVTSAQFLIDSESNLKKAVQAFGGANAVHNH